MSLSKTVNVFEKEYDGESLYDLSRDVSEAFDVRYNPVVGSIPTDEHGFQRGTFRVVIEWIPEEYDEARSN